MSPEALRRRLAHGNVYAADKVDAALGNYFRAGNLSALRELALLWVADRVDDALADYRERHGITATWETRERVVVALSGAPGGARLVRRAARIAQRAKGDLIGVHVDRRQRTLRRRRTRRRDGDRRATAPARGARRHLPPRHRQRRRRGARRGRPLGERHPDRARRQRPLVVAPAGQRLGRSTGSCGGRGRSTCTSSRTGPTRTAAPLATSGSDGSRPSSRCSRRCRRAARRGDGRSPSSACPVWPCCSPTPATRSRCRRCCSPTSCWRWWWPSSVGCSPPRSPWSAGSLIANYWFTPPYYRLTIQPGENLISLVVYVVAAGMVAVLVDRVGRSRLRGRPGAGRGRGAGRARRVDGRSGVARRHARQGARHLRLPVGCPPRRPRRRLARAGRVRLGATARPRARRRHPRPRRRDHPRPRRRRAVGGRRAGAQRVRRPGGRRRRVATSPRRGRQGHRAGGGQRPARGAAAGGVARPAHPAGVDQGVDLQPAPARHRLAARRRSRSSRRRSRARPTASPTSSATCST